MRSFMSALYITLVRHGIRHRGKSNRDRLIAGHHLLQAASRPPVSTGRSGYGTPSGVFHPQSMARHYFARKYYNAPMPHAIFFYYGFAIHGTNDLAQLGGPASHGCVRLHPLHVATLFALVQRQGPRNTRIEISN